MESLKSRMARWDEFAILKTAREQGYAEGRAEAKAEAVKNLIEKLGLTDAQVANVADATVDFVKKIRQGLAQ